MEQNIGRRLTRGEVIHHVNGKRDDNRIENLKLMTVKDHCAMHALESPNHYDISKESGQGENHPGSKLTSNDVLSIRKNKELKSIAEMAKTHNVSKSAIKSVLSFKTWKNIK
jgi:hypothetical protein